MRTRNTNNFMNEGVAFPFLFGTGQRDHGLRVGGIGSPVTWKSKGVLGQNPLSLCIFSM
jgi:hypothetical protein